MSISIKVNGIYKPVREAYIKVNGIYKIVRNSYVKVNGEYKSVGAGEDEGYDPTDDLNSIVITNDLVAGGGLIDEFVNNLYGRGNNNDLNNYPIGGYFITAGSDNGWTARSHVVKLPVFSPILNQSQSWLDSKDFVISGSTANIASKRQIQVENTWNDSYVLYKNNAFNYLKLKLTNNKVRLISEEKSGRYTCNNGGIRYIEQADFNRADFLNRDGGNESILAVGYKGYSYKLLDSVIWKWEVDVNYQLTITHTPTGQSRTINHTIRFRTY